MGQTREQRVIKDVVGKPTIQKFTPIATDMFLPNHSGIASHPEFKKALATAGGSYSVSDKVDNYTVDVADFGSGTIFTMSNAGTKTFTLPTITASELGKPITFVKLGVGKVVIKAVNNQVIADSGANDTIYNDLINEIYATITLVPVTTTLLVIVGADGTWVTTD
jgi:hypothetical protein